MSAVELLSAASVSVGSAIDGGPTFSQETSFSVLVQNLAYTKLVGIWGFYGEGPWEFTPCAWSRSVPGNLEIWTASFQGLAPSQFAVEYQALGNVYWDNNAGYNYSMDTFGPSADTPPCVIIGVPNVLAANWIFGSGTVDSSGNLNVFVLLKNIAYQKQVGIRYTTDNWQTYQNAFGTYLQDYLPYSTPHQLGAESWQIVVPVGVGATGQYAVFYSVEGTTYWDNNFGLNYSF